MSRSGYTDDYCDDPLQFGRWRGMVVSAINGRRGQALIRELIEALDAMPVKELIKGELQEGDKVCALGAVGQKRGISMEALDPGDWYLVAETFDIATCLAQEVVYINDEMGYDDETPAQRFSRVYAWAKRNLKDTTHATHP